MPALQAFERILRDPDKLRQTTLESFVSLPVPLEDHRARAIGVFFFPVGRPEQGRPFRPPYCRATASLETEEVSVLRVQPWDLGMRAEPGTVLGKLDDFYTPPPDVEAKKGVYFARLDEAIASYDHGFAMATPAARAELANAFFALVFRPVLPAYRALSPRFIEWLETGRR